jgi:hypothetical protein
VSSIGNLLVGLMYLALALMFCGGPVFYLLALVFRYRKMTAEQQRDRDAERGICPYCGYDNRASGSRCSECGRRNPVYWKQELKALDRRTQPTERDGDAGQDR